MSFRLPDRFFSRISDIDVDKDICKLGIKNVLMDIDNTVLPRDSKYVPNDIKKWVTKAKDKGLKLCLISNDWHDHVYQAAKDLDIPIVVKALKPLPFAFIRALKKIGAKRKESVMVGDQLMTDVFGSHFIRMRCYLVLPLAKKDLKHTLMLRKVEKIFLGNTKPEPARMGD